MKEIYPKLFIGTDYDFNWIKNRDNWAIVHAAKEPYHRELLGYTSKGAPKNHPEYLFAKRGDILYLNLVDAPTQEFIPSECFDQALAFIDQKLKEGKYVLVHCNAGMSRSPSIGLLYLKQIGHLKGTIEEIKENFLLLYPDYSPQSGVWEFVKSYEKR